MAIPHNWQSKDIEDAARLLAWLQELDTNAVRDIALTKAQGFGGENFSRYLMSGGAAAVTGTVYYQGIYLVAGDVVTNVHVNISSAGAGMSANKVGVYDSAGNLLASSADLGTSWQSTGLKTHALSSPYSVSTSGFYYLALFCTFATTAPQPVRATAVTGNSAGTGSNPALFGAQTSQSDLPNPATIANTNQLGYWVAWS